MLYQRIFNQLEIFAPEIYEIFQIGRVLEGKSISQFSALNELISSTTKKTLPIDQKNSERQKQQLSQDWHVDVMRRLEEFPRILKKQFLLPDAAFDQKLISKELLVRQPETEEEFLDWDSYFEEQNQLNEQKRLMRQSTYLLVDVSGTTASHYRLLLEKAICLRFIESNRRDKGSVFLRFFNHDVSRLISSINGQKPHLFWSELLRPIAPFGGTNLQFALQNAVEDIRLESFDSDTEILVLTDGLAKIDRHALLKKGDGIKINFVIIGNDTPNLNDSEMRELFEEKVKSWQSKWEEKLEKEEYQKNLKGLESKFWANRFIEQKKYYDKIRDDLKKVSIETDGLFIQIPDLAGDFFTSDKILASLKEELDALTKRLNKELSVTEKEKLLERVISLQNYINSFSAKMLANKQNVKKEFQMITGRLRNLIDRDEELLEILKYARLKVRMTSQGKVEDISLAELFKILFFKMKSYFYRHRS